MNGLSWSPLGFIALNHDWQFFGVPVIGSETFRIRHRFSYKPYGRALIAQVFAIPFQIYGLRRMYPASSEATILRLPIPQDFLDQGINTRYIVVKASPRTRLYLPGDWRIELDVWNYAAVADPVEAELAAIQENLARLETKVDNL